MPYLIDGHNLIPHISGLNLTQLDDELELIEILEVHFRKIRKKAVVFFDKGTPGFDQNLQHGFVSAHFTRPPLNADKAIRNSVMKLGKSASNYTIVSSDHEVRNHAQRQGANVLSSDEFAKTLFSKKKSKRNTSNIKENDLDYWLDVFSDKP